MKSYTQVLLLCFIAVLASTLVNVTPQTLFWSGGHIDSSADVKDDSWSTVHPPSSSLLDLMSKPQKVASQKETPQRVAPQRVTSQNVTSRERVNSQRGTSQNVTSRQRVRPQKETSRNVTPRQRVNPQRGTSRNVTLEKKKKLSQRPQRLTARNETLEKVTSQKSNIALHQLQNSVTSLNRAIRRKNETEKDVLIDKIKNELWPTYIELALEYFDTIKDKVPKNIAEAKHHDTVRKSVARVLFKAKARRCVSANDTFFGDICVPYGNAGTPCQDDNLQLYDGPDNVGICDCKAPDSSGPYNGLIFSNVTGTCYVQNSKGPCADNEWVIVKDDQLVCEAVPEGCSSSDDGKNVYWSPDPSTPESCVELGSEQSCGILNRHGFELVCTPPLVSVGSESSSEPGVLTVTSPLKPQPCVVGSYRQQNGLCQ